MAEMLTVPQAAKVLNRRPASVRLYLVNDDLPHRREGRGGRILIDPAELAEWAARPEIRAMLRRGDRHKGLVPTREGGGVR